MPVRVRGFAALEATTHALFAFAADRRGARPEERERDQECVESSHGALFTTLPGGDPSLLRLVVGVEMN
jgi:hypothetical protein